METLGNYKTPLMAVHINLATLRDQLWARRVAGWAGEPITLQEEGELLTSYSTIAPTGLLQIPTTTILYVSKSFQGSLSSVPSWSDLLYLPARIHRGQLGNFWFTVGAKCFLKCPNPQRVRPHQRQPGAHNITISN